MRFCCVEWIRGRYPVGHKLKNRQSQACKCPETYHWIPDICSISKSKKFQGQIQSKVTCPVCIITTVLVPTKSIMRLGLFIINTFAVLALLMRANSMLTVLLHIDRKVQKRVSLGMAFGHRELCEVTTLLKFSFLRYLRTGLPENKVS